MASLAVVIRRLSLLIAATTLACGGGQTEPVTAPTRPVTFTADAWTQPVPSWGSPVRLNLPVALADIVMGPGGSFGAYGAHEGGHCEGLDHVWIPTRLGIPVRSWGAGTVTKVDDMGPRGTPDGRHEWFVTVDFGQGLVGQHLDIDVPLVKVGDHVKEGDAIGQMTGSAEFMLWDNNRTDGERTGSATGAFVSPFDYLRDDVKAAVVARHIAEVVTPFFSRGASVGNAHPWEPLLTNRMFFHGNHRGAIPGEWVLSDRSWKTADPTYFNLLIVFDVTNAYGHFQRVELADRDWSLAGNKRVVSGSWSAGPEPGTMLITPDAGQGEPLYARYRVDESSGRAALSIEWRRGSYPPALSSNAATYKERAPIYLQSDITSMGVAP